MTSDMIKPTFSLLLLLSVFFFESFLSIPAPIGDSIYLLNTEDGQQIEAFDCFDHQSQRYCRRPTHPINLRRDHADQPCLSDGIQYSFNDLIHYRTSPSLILHGWRSTVDKVEDFIEYQQSNGSRWFDIAWLCHCVHPQSFGKHCEYQLPLHTTLQKLIATKFVSNGKKLDYEGDIVCYGIVKCDYGLLCLDWRDICDGVQQCMYGVDETNCEKIEFNECEEDEYRCQNGMCIPDDFFLDGDYDCMDMSDEQKQFDGADCPYQEATFECDDRVIRRGQWSCGDGQAVLRMVFKVASNMLRCVNRRDQFFWCETVDNEVLWTQPNGRCGRELVYDQDNLIECCYYLRICLSFSSEQMRPECGRVRKACGVSSRNDCKKWTPRHYPKRALVTPFMFSNYSLLGTGLGIEDSWRLEGTIKCIHKDIQFDQTFKKIRITLFSPGFTYYQYKLCESNGNYNQYCLQRSKMFSNRSLHHPAVCKDWSECYSPYRTETRSCPSISYIAEATFRHFINGTCRRLQKYRFRCFETGLACLYTNQLGNARTFCPENYQQSLWGGRTLVSNVECTPTSKRNCYLLRQYIASSWNSTLSNQTRLANYLVEKLPFRFYCDTFDQLSDGSDETLCEDWRCSLHRWQCASGQCINESWLFDGTWDCPDGSDEENFFFHRSKGHNRVTDLSDDELRYAFMSIYPSGSLWIDCSFVNRSSCYPLQTANISEHRKICFNSTFDDHEHIDFPSHCDEKSVADFGSRSLRKLNYNFHCLSIQTCLQYWKRLIGERNTTCACQHSTLNGTCGHSSLFQCWNVDEIGTRCNDRHDCSTGEDEFLCSRFRDNTDRTDKEQRIRREQFSLQLESDQSSLFLFNSSHTSSASPPSNSTTHFVLLDDSTTLNRCNRGIAIRLNKFEYVCFCPPQYHGDQCQWHSDRLTLFFAVNLTHSNYQQNNMMHENIIIKYLIFLLFDEKVIDNEEIHLRPIEHMTKARVYLHYSRSPSFTEHRQQRFLNQSSLIHQHAYRIRIEAFELKPDRTPLKTAVWQYSLDFDYLPVHRVAKLLHFIDPSDRNITDPCQSNPCASMKSVQCYRVQNRPSDYLCMCARGYSGSKCSDSSALCVNNYCSTRSLCQPGYRALIDGHTDRPYCICPLNAMGVRCHLTSDACTRHLCHNGGTCFQTSTPNRAQCWCAPGFTGDSCETRPAISDYTSTSDRVLAEELFVVQSLMIDPLTLLMIEVHRQLYRDSSAPFEYQREDRSNIELLLLRVYSVSDERIHLLGVLQVNDSSVQQTLPAEHNHCEDIQRSSESFHFISPSLSHPLDRSHSDAVSSILYRSSISQVFLRSSIVLSMPEKISSGRMFRVRSPSRRMLSLSRPRTMHSRQWRSIQMYLPTVLLRHSVPVKFWGIFVHRRSAVFIRSVVGGELDSIDDVVFNYHRSYRVLRHRLGYESLLFFRFSSSPVSSEWRGRIFVFHEHHQSDQSAMSTAMCDSHVNKYFLFLFIDCVGQGTV